MLGALATSSVKGRIVTSIKAIAQILFLVLSDH